MDMKTKPILFSKPMVTALLEGKKTQTRRKIDWKKVTKQSGCTKGTLGYSEFFQSWAVYDGNNGTNISLIDAPNLKKGDVLWVRETWQHTKCLGLNWEDENYGYIYRADDQPWEDYEGWTWKPSIFMPKEACRIFLKVTNIRVERLHDISEKDAIAEGIENFMPDPDQVPVYRRYTATNAELKKDHWAHVADDAQHSFFTLWESINGKESLEQNPWVWVYEFEATEKPENFI